MPLSNIIFIYMKSVQYAKSYHLDESYIQKQNQYGFEKYGGNDQKISIKFITLDL